MKNNLYVIRVYGKNNESIIKFGYSSKIDKRLKTYFAHNPLFEVIFTCYHRFGKSLEIEFHKKYKSIILNEWYSENMLEKIIDFIKSFKYSKKRLVIDIKNSDKRLRKKIKESEQYL